MIPRHTNYYKKIKQITLLVGFILYTFTTSLSAVTINGRIVALGSNNSKFSVLLQINTNTGTDDLGGATMVLRFDTTAIQIPANPVNNVDYVFHNFSGGNYYPATVTKPLKNRIWVNIDLPFDYNNNGTIVAGSPEWTNVVTIHFSIVNQNLTPGLSWLLNSPFWGIYDADNLTIWDNGIFDGNFGLAVEVVDGWNIVSVPGINPNGQSVNDWWHYRDRNSSVYKLQGGYIPVNTTSPGEGYFMKHTGNRSYNTGDEWPENGIQIVPHNPIQAVAGWNLVGGYEEVIAITNLSTTPPGLILGPIYTFAGTYSIANQLEPGRGYLIHMAQSGRINFNSIFAESTYKIIDFFKNHWGKITLTDYSGNEFSLYLVNDDTDLSMYFLPPVPPENMFDIRFRSGRIAENINCGIQSILLRGVEYPVRVKVENMKINLKDESGSKINTDLSHGDEYSILNSSVNKLFVQSCHLLTPGEFKLEQNFPNPLNPVTTIKYRVSVESHINISLYNSLGELVLVMVNREMKPGFYECQIDASNFASGVYLYRMVADKFVETKKMILIK